MRRDVSLKIERFLRIVLTYLSRTQYRSGVKDALKSKNFDLRLDMLATIDLETIACLNKSVSLVEFKKKVAFQVCQTTALLHGKEIYTNRECCEFLPDLTPHIKREESDLSTLDLRLKSELSEVKSYMDNFKTAPKGIL